MAETTEKKKRNLFSLIDQTIGEEGIRTDLKITMTPQTAWTLGAVIVGSIVVGGIALEFIKGIIKQSKQ
ncbi:MAG: hypothetical protein H6585_10175 [Flavobacteriales bacterium]|nr:hypothetical protein [Flavobacteriales bacterium]